MKDHNEMYHMDYKDTKKQAYKDKSDGSETSRRGLLSSAALATVAASLGVLPEGSFAEFERARNNLQASPQSAGQAPFETAQVEVSGNTIFMRRYGKGPAILMVHGFPRTSLMWRFLAPKLAENHTVICVDLRAYGRSGIPTSTNDHFPYSKRAMANELVEVMDKLGFPTFTLIGHDRGGRVSYRMALDHPKNVERLAVFDVLPLLEAWSRADARIAQAYWPWSLLSQKEPLPEIVPAAYRGIMTAILLALARVAGETAPLLFTAFGNRFESHGWSQPTATLAGDDLHVCGVAV
jgi:pimeloyl-ACP methyl ester carboxylesterase